MPRGVYKHKSKSEEWKAKISAAKIGKHPFVETKAKISVSLIGVPKSEEHKTNMRKPKSKEHRANISASQVGDKNSNWKGGKSNEPYPSKFRKLRSEIKKRDAYRCMICKLDESKLKAISGKGLFIHHIDYVKENCDKSNLVSLCNRCHSTVNGNRGYWTNQLKQLIFLNQSCDTSGRS